MQKITESVIKDYIKKLEHFGTDRETYINMFNRIKSANDEFAVIMKNNIKVEDDVYCLDSKSALSLSKRMKNFTFA